MSCSNYVCICCKFVVISRAVYGIVSMLVVCPSVTSSMKTVEQIELFFALNLPSTCSTLRLGRNLCISKIRALCLKHGVQKNFATNRWQSLVVDLVRSTTSPVCHTERLPLCTTRWAWCTASPGSLGDSWAAQLFLGYSLSPYTTSAISTARRVASHFRRIVFRCILRKWRCRRCRLFVWNSKWISTT